MGYTERDWANSVSYAEASTDIIDADYPNGGTVIGAYFLYDPNLLIDIVANGGWNYTTHLPTDYTPHKL